MSPVKKETVKAETKKVVAAAKTETKKAAATAKTETKKAEASVKAAPKKTAAKKTTTRRTAAKKTETKKAAAKEEAKTTVVVEFYGKQVNTADIVAKAEKAYTDAHKDAEIKTLEVYVKPEEDAAYYVVNGEGSDDFKVSLD